ncbi:hypothetical protein cypCar_00011127 [Cyprinus carpio]|nr:hypothetical protein cypCar_00011127 [Cyprinus carpio]
MPQARAVPNHGQDRDGICRSWGQHHFETFDGMYYYFPGTCSYILAKDCHSTEPQYTVWVHNSRSCRGSVYSCPRGLTLFFPNEEEIYISGYQVLKGGHRLSLPQTVRNVFFERLADYILVKSTFGFSLAWDGNSGVYLKMTEAHKGRPCGLCGNYNDDGSDDLSSSRGIVSDDIADFGNSWAVNLPQERSCPEDAIEKCSALLFFPFISCHENIDPNPFVASCVSDMCVSDDEETFCRTLVEYTRACSHVGYPVREWRDSFPTCADGCEDSFVHRDCISCCPPTCTFEKECLGTNLHCLDGCYCPDAECTVMGDAHVTTFDGRIFMHMGSCQYVLVKSRGSTKFTVTLQYTACGESQEHSCIHSVALVVDEDVSRQLTLTREGEIVIGASMAVNLPYSDDMVNVRRLTSMFVGLRSVFGLRFQYDWQGGRIYLQLDSTWIGSTLGLCGTLNGNLRDDFLSPAGMIEGTPQLHVNAWKVSSACLSPVNIPIIDPCEMNQQNGTYVFPLLITITIFMLVPKVNSEVTEESKIRSCDAEKVFVSVFYAAQCDVLLEEVFAPCHAYVSPSMYHQQCRYQACRCGSACLCTALSHYAYICNKHHVTINFRAHVSECGMVCLGGMMYHPCTSACGRTCQSISSGEVCDGDCAEGCSCTEGTFYDHARQRCVLLSQCHCYFMGSVFQPGEVSFSSSGPCLCSNGQMECVPEEREPERGDCPNGKVYYSCRSQSGRGPSGVGVACELTCRNLMLNLTCPPMTPCVPGCGCPAGLVAHNGECYYPENCPCAWLGLEYLPGESVDTPCYRCDRHYHTFDGLEYDYVSDCQVYLVKSVGDTEVSIMSQNKDCYESGIVCMKYLLIYVGLTKIYFSDNSGKPSSSTVVGRGYEFQLWGAGYYTVVHFPAQDLTILWDRKTTIHIRAGPQWKGQMSGLCGNFDMVTVNDMTTAGHMEVSNAQAFGDSWAVGQCESDFVVRRLCEGDLSRQPYAKRECGLLYSDVFAPCHNVVDVTWFYKNCLTDTCNCNRGGDCECLCTSIAAYAHKCCQNGITVNWRSPTVCPYDCEYYNQESSFVIPYRLICEWKYHACASPCVKTCNDPDATRCQFLPPVEGCFPRCPKSMLLDEVTRRCVYKEDCVILSPTPTPYMFVTRSNRTTAAPTSAPITTTTTTTTPSITMATASTAPSTTASTTIITTPLEAEDLIGSPTTPTSPPTTLSSTMATTTSTETPTTPSPPTTEPPLVSTAPPTTTATTEPITTLLTTLSTSTTEVPTTPEPTTEPETTSPTSTIPPFTTSTVITTETTTSEPTSTTITAETTSVSTTTEEPSTTTAAVPTTSEIMPSPSPSPETTGITTVLPPFLLPTGPCTPPYSLRVDECSEYICFNGQLMLHNSSQHCRYNISQPQCNLLGTPIQTNTDPCCPLWKCPCRCSIISDLRVITFDGNNVALYDIGSYILVHLPREKIVGHIEKCPTSESVNYIRRPASVNQITARLPLTRQNLHIDDTGTMYIINTPGGINIKWYHSTGIMVLQYTAPDNTSTRGLCGCCDGNPADDLRLPNGTVVQDVEDIPVFLHGWMVDTSEETDYFRRVGDNCTTGNCSKCFTMLNQRPFSKCHHKVSPEHFCDKIWAGDLHYKEHECDFLAAYVAICYTHQICFSWRKSNFCPLKCPPGKEYKPCVNTCKTRTCQNRDYYEESTCSSIREECVCKSSTILHRADSAFCVTEDQCVCTDNDGAPRAPGEVWNGSLRGCCLFKCLENECNLTICQSEVPSCENGDKLVIGYSALSCCPEYRCVDEGQSSDWSLLECDLLACQSVPAPICREDQFLVERILLSPPYYTVTFVLKGEVRVEEPDPDGPCGCPLYHCKKAEVCLFHGVTILNPGQSMVQYFEGELCYTVQCLTHKDPSTGFYAMEVTTANCSEKCEPAGSSWVANCTRFDCMETAVGAVVLASGVVCPPFNDTECIQNGGIVQTYVDGCCKTCKEDGKTCKRVAIRTTIRKDDCRSNAPVTVYSCDGKCPSATIFNFNINSHARFCKCCRENSLQNRIIQLYCTRNATTVDYYYQEPMDCSCQWN